MSATMPPNSRALHSLPDLAQVRTAQHAWAQTPLRRRLRVLRAARHAIASSARQLAETVPTQQPGALHRSVADTLVAEVLPLAEACRFLEREAAFILAPQRLSTHTRPLWLRRVTAELRRDPLGVVLLIAPANYPLFLPGAQALQALAAGNAVLWKPAHGGAPAALALRYILIEAGLNPALLQVLDDSPQAATAAIAAGVDKVFLTGSAESGRAVLHQLAGPLTPAVMELSGCDAVFLLPGADLPRTVEALAFGLRLNGSATCMAPRRCFLIGHHPSFVPALLDALKTLPLIPLPETTRALLDDLLQEATLYGARVHIEKTGQSLRYAVVTDTTPDMRIAQTDLFAPVLSVISVPDQAAALAAHALCPYALTAAVFGPAKPAAALAAEIPAGTVLLNDLIVSTADPRLPFGGRKASGFGVTRGREGLLEMTAPKTIAAQRSRGRLPYRPTTAAHTDLFAAYMQTAHGQGVRARLRALRQLLRAAARLKPQPPQQ